MRRRFASAGLTVRRFDAIDGHGLAPDAIPLNLVHLQYDSTNNASLDPLVVPGMPCRLTPGELGCALSHIALWDQILSSRLKYAVVMEDDIDLFPAFSKKLGELVRSTQQWDVIYLGYQTVAERPAFAPSSELLSRPEYLFGTYGYAISRSGAERLMALLPVVGPLDVFLSAKFCEMAVWCATSPVLRYQAKSLYDSDVAHSAHISARRL